MTEPAPTTDITAGPGGVTTTDITAGPGGVTTTDITAGPGGVTTTDITAGPGGVMTDEVGVVTGDLTLRTDLADGRVTLHVQYREAEEWYTVTGGLTTVEDPADVQAVHEVAVGLLNRPEG